MGFDFVDVQTRVELPLLEMLAMVDASAVCILKQPHFKCAAIGIKLIHFLENVDEHDLDDILCLDLILDDSQRDAEHKTLITVYDGSQRIVVPSPELGRPAPGRRNPEARSSRVFSGRPDQVWSLGDETQDRQLAVILVQPLATSHEI